jgi:hypothetical protein
MSQIRLYIDEDAAEHAVITGLRDRGIDVLTVLEAGMTSATDEEQLAHATSQDRTIYSLNVGDFCRLHGEYLAAGKDHSGILVIPRQRYTIGEKIRQLISHIESVSAEEMKNRLDFL